MNRIFMIIIFLFLEIGLTTTVCAQDTGLVPVPVFTNAGVGAEVAYGSVTDLYTYSYAITNPETNTGEICRIDIDISQPKYAQVLSSDGLTITYGLITESFDESVAIFKGNFEPMVPLGIVVPSGWSGGVGTGGFASFSSRTGFPKILPGEIKGGFQLFSRGLPAIRSIEIEPWWVFATENFVSAEDEIISRETEESLKFTTRTIGPTAPPQELIPITFLDTIEGYIDESVTLSWLTDSTLITTLKSKLDSARALIEDNDPSSAKVVLGEVMDVINQATSSQIKPEARGLLFYNVQYLKNAMPDTYIPPVKTLSITPDKATLTLGSIHTLTVTSKIDGNPLPNYPVTV